MSRKWRNWCQNEVDEKIKGADSRDKVKHNGRSDQLFLERMMKVAEQEYDTIRYDTVEINVRSKAGEMASLI